MGIVLQFHARTSKGYRSGRNSWRDTPETRSTARTLSGGTSSHCEIACAEMPSGTARPARPPTALIARPRASFLSLIVNKSSIALQQSQVPLHCHRKAGLYDIDMTIGRRIRLARERLGLGQEAVADAAGVTKQAVYEWETQGKQPTSNKLPMIREVLKVTFAWLLAGDGPPPEPDSVEVRMDSLMVQAFQKKPSRAGYR